MYFASSNFIPPFLLRGSPYFRFAAILASEWLVDVVPAHLEFGQVVAVVWRKLVNIDQHTIAQFMRPRWAICNPRFSGTNSSPLTPSYFQRRALARLILFSGSHEVC